MIDLFDELLSICLDRLADGDTVADCVADFPEVPDLEGLLETAAALMAVQDERPIQPWMRVASEHPTGRVIGGASDLRVLWADSGAA